MQLTKELSPTGKQTQRQVIVSGTVTGIKRVRDDVVFFIETGNGHEVHVLTLSGSDIAIAAIQTDFQMAF